MFVSMTAGKRATDCRTLVERCHHGQEGDIRFVSAPGSLVQLEGSGLLLGVGIHLADWRGKGCAG